MKSTLFITAATLFVTAANAQVTDSTTQTTGTGNTTTTGTMGTTDSTRKLNTYGSYSTRDSIAAKYKLQPMPGALTPDKTFPILGTYQLNNGTDATTTMATASSTDSMSTAGQSTDVAMAVPAVTITMDSASKGIVWVDGLKQGRLKAYLKKSPATYRILAQKTGLGTPIPEGTMHLDPATNTLHIAMGAPYNEADPTAIFAMSSGTASEDNTADIKVKTKNSKIKSKVTFVTATKVDASQQMQQATGTSVAQPAGQQ